MIELNIPIRVWSEQNLGHWRIAHAKHKKQKQAVGYFLRPLEKPKLPVTVILTRLAPRQLDSHDNLRMGFKYIVDTIADWLTGEKKTGHGDSNELITWVYAQERSKTYGIKVKIEPVERDTINPV